VVVVAHITIMLVAMAIMQVLAHTCQQVVDMVHAGQTTIMGE
jgi:hypothetical protein